MYLYEGPYGLYAMGLWASLKCCWGGADTFAYWDSDLLSWLAVKELHLSYHDRDLHEKAGFLDDGNSTEQVTIIPNPEARPNFVYSQQ